MSGRLEDLVKPLGEMSNEQLEEHLNEVRVDRMTSKRVEKIKRKAKVAASEKVKKLHKDMTPEEKEKLIALLEG